MPQRFNFLKPDALKTWCSPFVMAEAKPKHRKKNKKKKQTKLLKKNEPLCRLIDIKDEYEYERLLQYLSGEKIYYFLIWEFSTTKHFNTLEHKTQALMLDTERMVSGDMLDIIFDSFIDYETFASKRGVWIYHGQSQYRFKTTWVFVENLKGYVFEKKEIKEVLEAQIAKKDDSTVLLLICMEAEKAGFWAFRRFTEDILVSALEAKKKRLKDNGISVDDVD